MSAGGGKGYAVDTLIPYGHFPQTHHVETLALLRQASLTPAALFPRGAE
ncbi:MAG: hypothetical protein MZV65_47520 [Chromatiales bacterium]|nr:hypothetical protein [Chromatiales bacterium]